MKKLADYRPEIGDARIAAIAELVDWLNYDGLKFDPVRIDACFRPSLVTRSEAEFLCVSAPRFSVRAYLHGYGFLTLRRLEDLVNSITQKNGKRLPLTSNPRNAIADSVLAVPSRIKSDYSCLVSDIGLLEYGEESPAEGVPYTSQLELIGGGVCAECVAMNATQILGKYATEVHGVAEIDSIAFSIGDGDFRPVILGSHGLSADLLAHYFRSANPGPRLSAFVQKVHWPLSVPAKLGLHTSLALALQAYVGSGMPVVYPNDLTQMNRSWVYSEAKHAVEQGVHEDIILSNGCPDSIRKEGWGPDLRVRPHAVLVVGAERYDPSFDRLNHFNPDRSHSFVLNCPATSPFLSATDYQLLETVSLKGKHEVPVILPVTPSRVTVSLLPHQDPAGSGKAATDDMQQLSATEVAEYCFRFAGRRKLPKESVKPWELTGCFRLIDLIGWSKGTVPPQFGSLPVREERERNLAPVNFLTDVRDVILKYVRDILKTIGAADDLEERWVWVQPLYQTARPPRRYVKDLVEYEETIEREILIWCAEAPPFLARDSNGIVEEQSLREERAIKELETHYLIGAIEHVSTDRPGGPRDAVINDDRCVPGWRFVPNVRFRGYSCAGQTSIRILSPDAMGSGPTAKPNFLGLIDSFDAEGRFPPSGKHAYWPPAQTGPDGILVEAACEAYFQMSPRLQQWNKSSGPLSTALGEIGATNSAMAVMRAASKDTRLAELLAEAMAETYRETVKIRAIASFFQGLAAHPGTGDARLAREALQGLISIALRLRERKQGHDVQTIEVVSGSRIEQTFHASTFAPGPSSLFATVSSRTTSLYNLVHNLGAAIRGHEDVLIQAGLMIACEVEPGPLFSANSYDAALALVSLIQHSNLERFVGLNYDISHFIQSGFRQKLPPALIRHVAHIHISGHSTKGHYGDTEITVGQLSAIADLVHAVSVAASRPLMVSGELECARTETQVENSWTAMFDFLR